MVRNLFRNVVTAWTFHARLFIPFTLFFTFSAIFEGASQTTCTVSGSGTINWVGNGAGQYTCSGSGTPIVLIIPDGVTVNFNSNDDTWAGGTIQVLGDLNITFNGSITINATIEVKSTGSVDIISKLYLGTTDGCGHRLIVDAGGTVNLNEPGADDRVYICGNKIAQSGGQCYGYPDPGNQLPFCEPDSPPYFTGPLNWDENGGITPTPVELISFKLHLSPENEVVASWATASEKNSDYFAIERSFNGKDFYILGTVPAAGTTNLRQDYAFTDHFPLIGRGYYRLKQIDLDGTTEYFPVKFIDLTGNKRVMVYPTILENNELTVKLNFTTEEVAYARILSVAGYEVGKFNFVGSEFRAPVGLAAGAYVLKVNIGSEQFLERFIVR